MIQLEYQINEEDINVPTKRQRIGTHVLLG